MTFRLIITLLITLCFALEARGQIVLSQEFDSGSLDVARSTVNGNDVFLKGRHTWEGFNFYQWIYFKAESVRSRRPIFTISADEFLGSYTNHLYVYSYDQQNWEYFDNGIESGGDYAFFNDQPFDQDTVYIAYGLPYSTLRVADHVRQISSSPYVSLTLSGDDNFVVARSAAGTDDLGRLIPSQPVYGFKLTDNQVTSLKRVVVLASGSHSAETPGNYALEGMVDFLLSSDSRARSLRERFEFYVYPLMNPSGRFAGYYRSNPENPGDDFNRFFDNPAGFTELNAITHAMQMDTGRDVDVLIDFHSWWGGWTSENFVFTVSDSSTDAFFNFLELYEPGMFPVVSAGHPGMLRIWSSTPAGLNAKFAITPEIGFHPNRNESYLKSIGESFAHALYERSLPEPTAPNDVAVLNGTFVSGDIADVGASDNVDYVARRSNTDINARITLDFNSVCPVSSPFEMAFSIEASVFSRLQVSQTFELFDYATNQWEIVHVGTASRFIDSTTTIELSGDLTRFIEDGTRSMRARCLYQGAEPRAQFTARIDHVNWIVEQ